MFLSPFFDFIVIGAISALNTPASWAVIRHKEKHDPRVGFAFLLFYVSRIDTV